jgi:hypothetical protein
MSGRVGRQCPFALVRSMFRVEMSNDSLRQRTLVVSRTYLSAGQLASVAAGLSARDRDILRSLQRVRVATALQLERLHFVGESPRHRRRVLADLAGRRLLARLDRTIGGRRAGSVGHVFALDVVGLRVLSVDSDSRGRRTQRPTTPGMPFLAHALAVTEVYVRLVEAERRGGVELVEFVAEPACWRRYSTAAGRVTLKPDAYVQLGMGAYLDSWFVELDRATASSTTITRKLATYRSYWQSGKEQADRGAFPWVLWLVPDERRHEVLVDLCGKQPADSWRLFMVSLFEGGVDLMVGGGS